VIRLYFNLTDKCNEECEFCCMYSSPNKNTFLTFDSFKSAIDTHNDEFFELQLEGGEPFLNPNLYLFMQYAIRTNRCKKIILCTNGRLLDLHLEYLIQTHNLFDIPITIKQSINYWLCFKNPNLIKRCRNLYASTEFIPGFDILFNVRIRNNDLDANLLNELDKEKLLSHSSIYPFQSYGKLSEDKEYSNPVINQNVDDWFLYSSDGVCFYKDLIKRSEYEKNLK
jgi:4Fe-4S single cluster domain